VRPSEPAHSVLSLSYSHSTAHSHSHKSNKFKYISPFVVLYLFCHFFPPLNCQTAFATHHPPKPRPGNRPLGGGLYVKCSCISNNAQRIVLFFAVIVWVFLFFFDFFFAKRSLLNFIYLWFLYFFFCFNLRWPACTLAPTSRATRSHWVPLQLQLHPAAFSISPCRRGTLSLAPRSVAVNCTSGPGAHHGRFGGVPFLKFKFGIRVFHIFYLFLLDFNFKLFKFLMALP